MAPSTITTTIDLLDSYLRDADIEEIWINDLRGVFVAKSGVASKVSASLDADQLMLWVERLLISSNRRLDMSSPFVDATLTDGSRLHVGIPDVVRHGWSINVRKFIGSTNSLERLVELQAMNSVIAVILEAAVINGYNILIAGGTGAGKTTLLNALLAKVPSNQRIITCEEVCELSVTHDDWVSMQTRPPGLEGTGEIDLRELIRQSLRMRPERLLVGEVRGAESLDLLLALNSGQPGMATLHANSVDEAVLKLCTLPLLAGDNITTDFVVPTVAQSVDIIVHVERTQSGMRRVTEVGVMTGRVRDYKPEVVSVLRWANGDWTKLVKEFPLKRIHQSIDISLLWRGL